MYQTRNLKAHTFMILEDIDYMSSLGQVGTYWFNDIKDRLAGAWLNAR